MYAGDPRDPENVSPATRGCLSVVVVVLSIVMLIAGLLLWSSGVPLILRLSIFAMGALALVLGLYGLRAGRRDE
ncbi:hypothetical protein AB0M20_21735 [Actinoplanes sp. NPDC051633]|uniref:hypothetical protein n=1 Tax=Actinoplanes sp. NPDC051633 TaxID=3155670 RepID=UPI00341B66A3